MFTNEYTRLYGIECDDVVLLPNQPFEAFRGKYKVGSYARILNADGKEVMKLSAGETINGIGILSKSPKDYSTDEAKPMTATKLLKLQEESNKKYRKEIDETLKKPHTRKKKEVKDGK